MPRPLLDRVDIGVLCCHRGTERVPERVWVI